MSDPLALQPPQILWKYRKWDDECDKKMEREFARNMIVHGELYYCPKGLLNDPMDMHWREAYPQDLVEQFVFAKAFLKFNRLQSRDPETQLQSVLNIMRAQQLYNADAVDGIIGTRVDVQQGVFCVSERPDDFLMWSHYAAGHAGICIGIRTAAIRGRFGKCEYIDVPPLINAWDFITGNRDEFVRASLTKARRWEYEQEWRSISTPGPKRFPDCIDSLIFGVSIDDDTRGEVLAAVAESRQPIKLFRAKKDPLQYRLEVVEFAG